MGESSSPFASGRVAASSASPKAEQESSRAFCCTAQSSRSRSLSSGKGKNGAMATRNLLTVWESSIKGGSAPESLAAHLRKSWQEHHATFLDCGEGRQQFAFKERARPIRGVLVLDRADEGFAQAAYCLGGGSPAPREVSTMGGCDASTARP